MKIEFMEWLRNNYPLEVTQDFIDTYTNKGNKDLVSLKPYEEVEVEEYVNFAFTWEFAKFGTNLWENINTVWYNYCQSLEYLPVTVSFGTLYPKEKIITKLEIQFHN
jgi:hypothetical protein